MAGIAHDENTNASSRWMSCYLACTSTELQCMSAHDNLLFRMSIAPSVARIHTTSIPSNGSLKDTRSQMLLGQCEADGMDGRECEEEHEVT